MNLIKKIEEMEEFDEEIFDLAIEELETKFNLLTVGLEEMERLILIKDLETKLKDFPALEELYNLSLEKLGIPANEVLATGVLAIIIAGILVLIGWIIAIVRGLNKFGSSLANAVTDAMIDGIKNIKFDKIKNIDIEKIDEVLKDIIENYNSSDKIGAVSFINDVLTVKKFSNLTIDNSNFYKLYSIFTYLERGKNTFSPYFIESILNNRLSFYLRDNHTDYDTTKIFLYARNLNIKLNEEIEILNGRLENDIVLKELKEKNIIFNYFIKTFNKPSNIMYFFKPIDLDFNGSAVEIKYEIIIKINLEFSDYVYIKNYFKVDNKIIFTNTGFEITDMDHKGEKLIDKIKLLNDHLYPENKSSISNFKKRFTEFSVEIEDVLKDAKKIFEKLKNKDDITIKKEINKLLKTDTYDLDQSKTILKLIKYNINELSKLTRLEALSQKVFFKGANELLLIIDILDIMKKSKNNKEAKTKIINKIK